MNILRKNERAFLADLPFELLAAEIAFELIYHIFRHPLAFGAHTAGNMRRENDIL